MNKITKRVLLPSVVAAFLAGAFVSAALAQTNAPILPVSPATLLKQRNATTSASGQMSDGESVAAVVAAVKDGAISVNFGGESWTVDISQAGISFPNNHAAATVVPKVAAGDSVSFVVKSVSGTSVTAVSVVDFGPIPGSTGDSPLVANAAPQTHGGFITAIVDFFKKLFGF